MINEKEYQERFTKGFNEGYLLSRFEPQVYEQVMQKADSDNPYFRGMSDGHRKHEREVFESNLRNSRRLNEQLKPKM
jgi:hypothetical protein